MEETSWALNRSLDNPFARPRGLRGRLAGRFMAVVGGRTSGEVAALLALRPRDTVLEVGYGPGTLLAALAQRPERPVLVGVDPSAEMAELAARRVGQAELRLGTAAETRLPDASVDHAVSVNNVAIWPDLDAGLDELCRVVRPGGTVLLAWHGVTARSRISRSLALSTDAWRRIEVGLAARCARVGRVVLTDVEVAQAVR
ncbi:class I SAM-dependent methyltransferase [Pseudonocardia sp.]|uniref:class I SAM-dependent methyltransferase n=1 Tax=Pseudonocardia sp. TaxID=60912 RepID=UPI003D1374AE